MKKSTKGSFWLILFSVFFIALSSFMLYIDYYKEWPYIKGALSGGFQSYSDVIFENDGEINEGYYSLNIDGCLGCFGTMSEGKDVQDYYYVVWLDDNSFVALDVSKDKEAKALDEIEGDTWDYIDGVTNALSANPLAISAQAKSLDSESKDVRDSYIDYLQQCGVTADNYNIRMTVLKSETLTHYKVQKIAEFIACVLFLFAGIVLLIATVAKMIRKSLGIREPVDIESNEDYRANQVSFLRARNRITSRRLKWNMAKMRLEILGSFVVGVLIFGLLWYDISNPGKNAVLTGLMKEWSQLVVVLAIGSVFLFFAGITRLIGFINNLKVFSDVDFERIEDELDRPSTKIYPQNLYLTDSFIVKLHSGRYHGATTGNDVDTFFAKYKDIEWVYGSIIGLENANYHDNIGATVYGRDIGKQVIIRFSKPNQNTVIVNEILDNIIKKNPDIKVGYTEENKEYFKNLENDSEKVS
ncbi:DUF6709 family protein [Butyrivibrio proteoclasticus]|uniref:DUF6709 family protein n=1 Tax=Butyrivibrio proteoclasticus TaxID=43305 RepID=UPI00047EA7E8|nr:DUF6709 family protein [Butyrivibrio proteoclasticus]